MDCYHLRRARVGAAIAYAVMPDFTVRYIDIGGAAISVVVEGSGAAAALRSALSDGPEPALDSVFTIRPALATDAELSELVEVSFAVARAYQAGLWLGSSGDDGVGP